MPCVFQKKLNFLQSENTTLILFNECPLYPQPYLCSLPFSLNFTERLPSQFYYC